MAELTLTAEETKFQTILEMVMEDLLPMAGENIICDQYSVHMYCEIGQYCCEDNTRCCSFYFDEPWFSFYPIFVFIVVCFIIYKVSQPRSQGAGNGTNEVIRQQSRSRTLRNGYIKDHNHSNHSSMAYDDIV